MVILHGKLPLQLLEFRATLNFQSRNLVIEEESAQMAVEFEE